MRARRPFLLAFAPLACGAAQAQAPVEPAVAAEPIVVTATRTERPALDVPASVDVIGGDRIRGGQPQVNLSETLPALAGVVANHRQNYAQDLQVSIRGFGARSTFGVRGLRVIVDGIPATLPDGQAQVSHVDLASADRIEVLRGPFSVLYGNSSGGVVNVVTQAAVPGREASVAAMAGSDATRRAGALLSATEGALGYTLSAGRFETDGYREHSRAVRKTANAKLRYQASGQTSATFVANVLDMPDTQDPLGLARAQFERDPRSVDPAALRFDTRKSVDQAQAGVLLDHAAGAAGVRLALHGGERGTQQFQSIPVGPQMGPLHPGGVIDLGRRYSGADLRWTWSGSAGATPFTLVAGANLDRLAEERRGFRNFAGTQLGVQGELRRDETNRVTDAGAYAQAEWDFAAAWRLLAGVRASRVDFRSADHYVTPTNPDDSGRVRFTATTPVAGVVWRPSARSSVYAGAGRGFETPTTNELAYRSDAGSGLNLDLDAARSDHYEAGAKWLDAGGWRATAAAFRIDTDDEIVVASNAGGRSTFRNAGRTRRDGFELQLAREWRAFGVSAALTHLRARYVEGFGAASGNRIPGVPRGSAYAELRWRPREAVELALEARHSGAIAVNDANSDSAPAYTVANLRFASRWRLGPFLARPFLRVDNVFDRRYAGAVIVNESSARYFEPAPGRTWLAGASLAYAH